MATVEATAPHNRLDEARGSLTSRVFNKLHGIINSSKDRRVKDKEGHFLRNEKAAETDTKAVVKPPKQGQFKKKNPLFQETSEDLEALAHAESELHQRREQRRKERANRDKDRGADKRARVTKRQSAPALAGLEKVGKRGSKQTIGPRSASQPVLVKFIPQYVNRLKAQPFSLKEKMTSWCVRSSMALIKAHEPPQDHYLEFPNQPYTDKMCDEFGRNLATLEETRGAATTKPRQELVLKRYSANKHGVRCSYDRIPADDGCGAGAAAAKQTAGRSAAARIDATKLVLSQPAPAFDEIISQRSSTSTPVGTKPNVESCAPSKPPPMFVSRRMPTNISLIPQTSRVDAEMLMAAMRLTDARDARPHSVDIGSIAPVEE